MTEGKPVMPRSGWPCHRWHRKEWCERAPGFSGQHTCLTAEDLAQQEAERDLARVRGIVAALPPESRARVNMVAGILRGLINAYDGGEEVELAFTLVLSERVAL